MSGQNSLINSINNKDPLRRLLVIVVSVLAIVVIFGLVVHLFGANKTNSAKKKKAIPAVVVAHDSKAQVQAIIQTQETYGTVTALNKPSVTITTPGASAVTYNLTSSTVYYKNVGYQPGNASGLTLNSMVRISYNKANNNLITLWYDYDSPN